MNFYVPRFVIAFVYGVILSTIVLLVLQDYFHVKFDHHGNLLFDLGGAAVAILTMYAFPHVFGFKRGEK